MQQVYRTVPPASVHPKMADTRIRTIDASDGMRLHFRHWTSDVSPAGIVVALHGIQSHSGWYEYSSRRLADAGFPVYFADRRGSGLNGRPRGHADHGQRLLNDVRQLVRLARREQPDVPLTLLGLSWGGKTAAAFAASCPNLIDRLVLMYPGLKPWIRPTLWQRFQLSFARRHDIRRHPVTIPLQNPALFTDNVEKQQFIVNDPLALEYVTSGFLNAGRDLDAILFAGRAAVTHPTLLMLAGRDQIVDNLRTKQLVEDFSSQQLSSVVYRDASHTLEFDQRRDAFINDLIAWLETTEAPA